MQRSTGEASGVDGAPRYVVFKKPFNSWRVPNRNKSSVISKRQRYGGQHPLELTMLSATLVRTAREPGGGRSPRQLVKVVMRDEMSGWAQ